MCNSAHDILICKVTQHACTIHLGLERKFKEICQNLRKFGSSKKEFQFQAVEALTTTSNILIVDHNSVEGGLKVTNCMVVHVSAEYWCNNGTEEHVHVDWKVT